MSCADIPYDTLFVAVYTVVDDWYREVGWQLVRSRPGVKPRFSDSEVLTLDVVRELDGETRERRWYARVAANWRALFPGLPERSVLHKRTKSLGPLLDRCRCALRARLLDSRDPRRLLDGTPVPVCDVSRVGRPDGRSAGRRWHTYGAQIGRCAARAWWFYGFKLVLTATVDMLPDQAVLVPAAADEREAAAALLTPGLVFIGDRNFSRWASVLAEKYICRKSGRSHVPRMVVSARMNDMRAAHWSGSYALYGSGSVGHARRETAAFCMSMRRQISGLRADHVFGQHKPLHQPAVPGTPGEKEHPDQHGWQGPGARQHLHRAAVAHGQV